MVPAITTTATRAKSRRQPTTAERTRSVSRKAMPARAPSRTSRAAPLSGVMDVTGQLGAEEHFRPRRTDGAEEEQAGPGHGEHHEPVVAAALWPDQAPEGEGPGEQYVARVGHHPVGTERQFDQLAVHHARQSPAADR